MKFMSWKIKWRIKHRGNTFKIPKKQTLSVPTPEPAVIGEGEDYFLSLFGDSRKLNEHSLHTEKVWKHFSMILEEVGQSRSRKEARLLF